jgi:hypothetical protein
MYRCDTSERYAPARGGTSRLSFERAYFDRLVAGERVSGRELDGLLAAGAATGPDLVRPLLSAEAIRLTRLVAALLPGEPETGTAPD